MLVALRSIDYNQNNSNEKTAQAIKKLLYYCTTNPDATLCYERSDMVLRVHIDVSYMLKSQSLRKGGSNSFLGY